MTTPEFITAIAPVVRYAKAQGWQRVECLLYGADGKQLPFKVDRVRFGKGQCVYGVKASPVTWFEPTSPQQAVDVLVALGVLPLHLSSQYQKGVDDGEWLATPHKATAAAALTPDALPDGVEGVQIGGRS